jgi:hypothetical protein
MKSRISYITAVKRGKPCLFPWKSHHKLALLTVAGCSLEDLRGAVPLTDKLRYFEAKYMNQGVFGDERRPDALVDLPPGCPSFGGFAYEENFAK